jgi:hypothetical protein
MRISSTLSLLSLLLLLPACGPTTREDAHACGAGAVCQDAED